MRERYLDIIKGISILCITLEHYVKDFFPQEFNIFVGSFMITAFYVTSGWISAMRPTQSSIKEHIKKRWKQLGIPYLWWTFIILIFDLILFGFNYYDTQYILKEIYKTLTLRGIGTLWFLPALFGGEIIWFWLKKQNRKWIIGLVFIGSMLYIYSYNKFLGHQTETIYRIIDAPFQSLNNMLKAWIAISFGYYAFNFIKNFNFKAIQQFLLGLSLFICSFFLANFMPANLSFLWYLFAPLLGPLSLIFMIRPIQNSCLFNFFNFWGINSLNLMVTHYSIIMVLFIITIENLFHFKYSGTITFLCFILSMPIQYYLVFFINKYAKFTLGK